MTGRRAPAGDDGALTLLVIGFTFVAALMVIVTTSVSAVFLARRELASAVDAAAVAAAQQVDTDVLYRRTANARLPLSQDAADRIVAELAAHYPAVDFARPEVDGDLVVVSATREVDLRLAAVLGVESWTVRAVARARSPLR